MKSCLLLLTLLASFAQADETFTVSIDTSSLMGNAAGPFSLDFQFTDGSGADDGNNTAALYNFMFGMGSLTGSPTTVGTVSGNIATGFSLTDSSFLNELTQSFTPGNALTFQISLTTNVDAGGVPDEFTFAILDSSGAAIPTLGPFDTLLIADIDSSQPTPYTYGSDTTRGTLATGNPLQLPAPVITAAPEPSTLWFMASILALFVGSRGLGTRRLKQGSLWRASIKSILIRR